MEGQLSQDKRTELKEELQRAVEMERLIDFYNKSRDGPIKNVLLMEIFERITHND